MTAFGVAVFLLMRYSYSEGSYFSCCLIPLAVIHKLSALFINVVHYLVCVFWLNVQFVNRLGTCSTSR